MCILYATICCRTRFYCLRHYCARRRFAPHGREKRCSAADISLAARQPNDSVADVAGMVSSEKAASAA